jgi:hypothetical protein
MLRMAARKKDAARRDSSGAGSGSLLTARLFFFVVVDGDLLQILGLENLVTLHATQVVDPIPPHQKLRTLVLTDRHTRCRLSLF